MDVHVLQTMLRCNQKASMREGSICSLLQVSPLISYESAQDRSKEKKGEGPGKGMGIGRASLGAEGPNALLVFEGAFSPMGSTTYPNKWQVGPESMAPAIKQK